MALIQPSQNSFLCHITTTWRKIKLVHFCTVVNMTIYYITQLNWSSSLFTIKYHMLQKMSFICYMVNCKGVDSAFLSTAGHLGFLLLRWIHSKNIRCIILYLARMNGTFRSGLSKIVPESIVSGWPTHKPPEISPL